MRSKNPVVISLLPGGRDSVILTKRIGDSLFRDLNEPLEVSLAAASLDNEMKVIRHEAVRKDCEVFFSRSLQDSRSRGLDKLRSCKVPRAVRRAECQEISIWPAISEAFDATRSSQRHAPDDAIAGPSSDRKRRADLKGPRRTGWENAVPRQVIG